ncbi:unnamed protein product [Symbiodinium natans]|uniref:Uncharacterized protein n=1 Tax=Symbiodinium natans TaxID=878477 RepID=A0A812SKL8_9DINO|nr:unnamed protein product [Symbiodinium natans]
MAVGASGASPAQSPRKGILQGDIKKGNRRKTVLLWQKGLAHVKTELESGLRPIRTRSRGQTRSGSFHAGTNIPQRFRLAWEKGFRGIVAAVYADVLQERMADCRTAVPEALMINGRNNLFFLLLRIIQKDRSFETVSPIEEDEGAGGEPLWKVIESTTKPHNGQWARQGEEESSSHPVLLAQAQEEGPIATQKVQRKLSDYRRGHFASWHEFWSYYRETDKAAPLSGPCWRRELTELKGGSKDKVDNPGRPSRPMTRASAGSAGSDEQSEDAWNDWPPVEPESPLLARRPALQEDRNPLAERYSPTRRYSSFQDQKKCQTMLENIEMPTHCALVLRSGKEYHCPKRLGLSLSALPPVPHTIHSARTVKQESRIKPLRFGAATTRESTGVRSRLERKQAERQSEPLRAIKEMAGQQPSSKWHPGLHDWVQLRTWRHERHDGFCGENLRAASPVSSLKPSMTFQEPRSEPLTTFHRPWSAERGSHCGPDAPPLQRYAKVCMDCGLQPQQVVVGFLGQQLPFLDLRGLGYSDEDLLALTAAFPYAGILERVDLGQNSKITNRSVCPLLECVAARFADMVAALHLDKCIQIGRTILRGLSGARCFLEFLGPLKFCSAWEVKQSSFSRSLSLGLW